MLTVQNTILVVGIGLTLLSLCSCLPNVNDAEAKQQALTSFLHAKRQIVPSDNGTCFSNAAKNSLTIQACYLDYFLALLANTTSSNFCSSSCDVAYNAYVNCYGVTAAKSFYSFFCPNGYQGAAASHVPLNFAVVLMSVFIAAVLKITG